MTNADISAIVTRILIEELGCAESEVTPSAKLEDLGTDSLDAMEIALALEEAFTIEIPDAEIWKMETVEQVIDYCRKEINK